MDRVTSVASGELSVTGMEIAVRRTGKLAPDAEVARLTDTGAALGPLLAPRSGGPD